MVVSLDGQAMADRTTSVGFSGRKGFLASSAHSSPMALIIPIFYDRLIDNLSTTAKEGTFRTEKRLMNHHPVTSIAFHIKLPKIIPVRLWGLVNNVSSIL